MGFFRKIAFLTAMQMLLSNVVFINLAYAKLTPEELAKEQAKCIAQAKGQVFSEEKNRCITDDQTARAKQAAVECSELPTEDQNACREQLAVEQGNDILSEKGLERKNSEANPFDTTNEDEIDFQIRGLPLQLLTGAMIYYMINRKVKCPDKCPSKSIYIMFGAGIAAAIAEVVSHSYLISSYNEIYDEYSASTENPCLSSSSLKAKADNKIIAESIRIKPIENNQGSVNPSAPSENNQGSVNPSAPSENNQGRGNPLGPTIGTTSQTRSISEAEQIVGAERVAEIRAQVKEEADASENDKSCEEFDRLAVEEFCKDKTGAELAECKAKQNISFEDRSESEQKDVTLDLSKTYSLLIKQEEARATAAKIKAGGYIAAAAAYLTAVGFAIAETAKPGTLCPDLCKAAAKGTSSVENNEINKLMTEIQFGIAQLEFNELSKDLGIEFDFKDATHEEIQEITFRNILKVAGKDALKYAMPILKAEEGEKLTENLYNRPDSSTGGAILKTFLVIMGQAGVGALLGSVTNSFSFVLETAVGRISAATLLATNSGFIGYYALDEAELSSQRAAAIKELKTKFNLSGGAGFKTCSNKDRQDISKPACFCYLETGEKNSKRFKSKTCLNEFGEDGPLKPVDYRITSKRSKGPKRCVTNEGTFDDKCACRKAKRNAKKCATVQADVNFSEIDSQFSQGAIQQVDSITNGVLSPGDVEVGKTLNNAAKFSRRIKDLKKKLPSIVKDKSQLRKIQGQFNKLNKILGQQATKIAAATPSNSGTNVSSIKSPKDALKALKDNFKQTSKLKFKDSGKKIEVAKENNELDDFDFGGGNEASPGISIENLDEAMNKEFEFKGDINNNPDNNIFDILTLRYQRSGLRRLFDDEGKMQADEANDSDINE